MSNNNDHICLPRGPTSTSADSQWPHSRRKTPRNGGGPESRKKTDLQLDGKCRRLGALFPAFKSKTKAEGWGGRRIRLQTDKQRREAGGLYFRGNIIEWQADEYRKNSSQKPEPYLCKTGRCPLIS